MKNISSISSVLQLINELDPLDRVQISKMLMPKIFHPVKFIGGKKTNLIGRTGLMLSYSRSGNVQVILAEGHEIGKQIKVPYIDVIQIKWEELKFPSMREENRLAIYKEDETSNLFIVVNILDKNKLLVYEMQQITSDNNGEIIEKEDHELSDYFTCIKTKEEIEIAVFSALNPTDSSLYEDEI